MATSDGDVPLFHCTYAGKQRDSVTFSSVAEELADRCRKPSEGVRDLTLVFDKGNNSQENLEAVDAGPTTSWDLWCPVSIGNSCASLSRIGRTIWRKSGAVR